MMNRKNDLNKGFTLIELLVVIAIIGLLSSVVMASLSSARTKAHDARRLSDMRQIQIALDIYYDDNGQYPANSGECFGWDSSIEPLVAPTFISLLAPDYIDPVPLEQTNDTSNCYNGYIYNRYNAGAEGCDLERGAFYVLEAPGARFASPGFSYPLRDWQSEALNSWVAGKFEN